MPLEYEYRYFEYDKKHIMQKIKELGGIKQGHYIFRVMHLTHPFEKSNTTVRIRDEGHQITMTYKENTDKQFVDEHEVSIDNFDQGVNIFLGLGCKKKFYFIKMREIWNIFNTEIIFDIKPGLTEMMEVESPTKKELDDIVFKLGLSNLIPNSTTDAQVYENKFGIVIPKALDLDFLTVKKDLGIYVKKNKKEFDKLVTIQKKIYNKLAKTNT